MACGSCTIRPMPVVSKDGKDRRQEYGKNGRNGRNSGVRIR